MLALIVGTAPIVADTVATLIRIYLSLPMWLQQYLGVLGLILLGLPVARLHNRLTDN